MAAGDIKYIYSVFIKDATNKTNTAVAVGEVVKYDTDGYAPAVSGNTGPFAVALDAASATGQSTIRVLRKGVVEVGKDTGTLLENTYVVPGASGKVKARTNEGFDEVVGVVYESAASNDATVTIILG